MIEKVKLIHVQTILPEEIILKLIEETGTMSVKEALSDAVYFYLNKVESK